ncbi:MAG: hypothetical protein ACN2B6_02665 [Rickettsiales bacterium]
MGKILMRADGFDGQVELTKDRVIIHRQGVWNLFKYGLNARREIPLVAISEVVFKPPLMLGLGQIEFVRSGRSPDEQKKTNYSAVKFKKANAPQFEALKEKIFELIEEHSRHNH